MTETSISGEPASPHHVGIAIRAIGFSAMLGGTAGTLLLWGVRTLQQSTSQPVQSVSTAVFVLMVSVLLGAPALAGLSTWILTRPLISPWRRGGFAAVAGGLGLIVVILTPFPFELAGRGGLLAYAGLSATVCLLLSRKVAEGRRAR